MSSPNRGLACGPRTPSTRIAAVRSVRDGQRSRTARPSPPPPSSSSADRPSCTHARAIRRRAPYQDSRRAPALGGRDRQGAGGQTSPQHDSRPEDPLVDRAPTGRRLWSHNEELQEASLGSSYSRLVISRSIRRSTRSGVAPGRYGVTTRFAERIRVNDIQIAQFTCPINPPACSSASEPRRGSTQQIAAVMTVRQSSHHLEEAASCPASFARSRPRRHPQPCR